MSVVIGVPEKGRTGVNALEVLRKSGLLDSNIAYGVGQIHQEEKQRIKQEGKLGHYSTAGQLFDYLKDHPLAEYLHIQSDTERKGDPSRIVFNMAKTESLDGVPLLITGVSHYTAPQKLRSHEATFILSGWDEFYASLNYEIDERARHIAKWEKFNRYVGKSIRHERDDVHIKGYKRTDAEIAGSAGLWDIIGHWFIFSQNKAHELLDEKGNMDLGKIDKVYINPKYMAIYDAVLADHNYPYSFPLFDEKQMLFQKGQEIELIDVEDVEDAVLDNDGVGIEIVQTGRSLKDKGLLMAGLPIVESETIIAHAGQRNLDEDGLKILSRLNPLKYDSQERCNAYHVWYNTLESTIGDNWLVKPYEGTMFNARRVTAYRKEVVIGKKQ